jgi:toxin-antitoxin system PIN domain toxin
LAFESHFHHAAAKAWFDASSEESAFCRMTQQGFLRLATNPKALGSDAVSMSDAWGLYDELLNDPFIRYVGEPKGIEPLWRTFTQGRSFSPKVWNDAFLASFASAADFEIVTFDRGFAQYTKMKCTILS